MNPRLQNLGKIAKGAFKLLGRPRPTMDFLRWYGGEPGSEVLAGATELLNRSMARVDYCRWYAEHSRWIQQFHNKYRGHDCFLIGNGPSLNKINLQSLDRYHLIGLNKIFLLFERQPLDLTFHVAVNELVIQQSCEEFRNLSCPSFLSYRPAHPIIQDRENIHFVFTSQQIEPSFGYALDQPLWEGYTVTYVALQLAYFMGFKQVFLIGIDHNFSARGKPNEEQKLVGADQNHFDPRYFSNQQWHLPDLEGSELAYRMANFAFMRSGRSVKDATIDGKCTIFPKIGIDEAFAICHPRDATIRP